MEIPDSVPARDKFFSPAAHANCFALFDPDRCEVLTELDEAVAELLPAVFREGPPVAAKFSSVAVSSFPELSRPALSEAIIDCQLERKLDAAGTDAVVALKPNAPPHSALCALPVALAAGRLWPGSECPPAPISMLAATVMKKNNADDVPKGVEEG
jgi:hypothetical protein